MKHAALEPFLSSSPLFRGLPAPDLAAILRVTGTRAVGRGEFFFQQGDAATTFYLLVSGRARLLQITPDGNQVLLRFITPGEIFGVAFLSADVYPAAAQAVGDCVAAAWDGEAMTHLMERFPALAINALRLMAAQVKELQDRIRELSTERVERRIANALLRLVQQTGQKTAEGVLINLPLSRQDLAEMTGTTLYTVSRILSRWERDGIVGIGRERVVIRVPHRLVIIAHDLPLPGADKDAEK